MLSPFTGVCLVRRRLLAATTTLALVAGPAAAFAQEPEPVPDEPVEEASSLEDLAQALEVWADEMADGLEALLSDLMAQLAFSRMEADALAEVGELEAEEPVDGEDAGEDDGAVGEAVSTVAQCAPRGSFGALVDGMANHGEYMTAAAHGETVALTVPTIEAAEDGTPMLAVPDEETEPATTDFDLSTVEGAEALCDALDVVYQARLLQMDVDWEDVDGSREARVLAREQCQLERLRARNGAEDVDGNEVCAELRDRVKDEHEAERAERQRPARAPRPSGRPTVRPGRGAGAGQAGPRRDQGRACWWAGQGQGQEHEGLRGSGGSLPWRSAPTRSAT